MTKHYKERAEIVKKYDLICTTCDKCGISLPDNEPYESRIFELKFGIGFAYPDGGYHEGWQVGDLCNDCVEWLKGVLVDNGVNVAKLEKDW